MTKPTEIIWPHRPHRIIVDARTRLESFVHTVSSCLGTKLIDDLHKIIELLDEAEHHLTDGSSEVPNGHETTP